MYRTPGLNISNGNTCLMTIRGTFGIFVLVLALMICSGCVQPDKTMVQVPVDNGINSTNTPVPVVIPSPALPVQTGIIPRPVTPTPTKGPATRAAAPPAFAAGDQEPGGFVRYSGADYSLDYPAAWSTNGSLLPLREYRHSDYDCYVTSAYDLDQELRMFYSRDGRTLFYSSVINSGRDIWPRTVQGRIVYQDIVNAVLGNPENCANLEGNKAFTIGGISQVPLGGVSYPGVRADFARINLTGFTEGTGTMYVVTGKNHSGVFTFYSTAMDADAQANLSQYMFDSLHLDSGF
jgi:hypothetical protein